MKNNWEEKTIKDILDKDSSNLTINSLSDKDGKYSVYGASGIIKKVNFYQQCKPYLGMVKDGAGIGRIFFCEAKSSLLSTMQYLIPKDNINIKFAYYCLLSIDYKKYSQGAAIPHIYYKDYSKKKIFVPKSREQQKQIVENLDKAFANIDKLTEIAKQNLENSKELFNSYLNKFFGSMDVWMYRGIEVNRNKWKEYFLENLVEEITSSKRIYKKEYVEKGIPFYRTKEIKELSNNKQISVELFISNEKYQEIKIKYGIPKEKDLLISAVGTIGEMYIVKKEDKFYFKDGNILWFKNPKDIINIFFLKYILSNYLSHIKDITNGTAYNALTIEKLKKYKVLIPLDLQQQKQIVKILDILQEKAKKLEEIYNKKIELAKELKQSILHKELSNN